MLLDTPPIDNFPDNIGEYKAQRQQELSMAMTKRMERVKQIQHALDEKTQQRLRRYSASKHSNLTRTKSNVE